MCIYEYAICNIIQIVLLSNIALIRYYTAGKTQNILFSRIKSFSLKQERATSAIELKAH